MKRVLTMIWGCTLLLSACSKSTSTPDNGNKQDTTQTPSKPSKELMVGTWVYVSVTSDDPDNPNPLDYALPMIWPHLMLTAHGCQTITGQYAIPTQPMFLAHGILIITLCLF